MKLFQQTWNHMDDQGDTICVWTEIASGVTSPGRNIARLRDVTCVVDVIISACIRVKRRDWAAAEYR